MCLYVTVTHMYMFFFRVKGVLHILRSKKQCDETIAEYEAVISKCDETCDDIGEMKHTYQQIKVECNDYLYY